MPAQQFRIDVAQPVLDRIQSKLEDSRIGYMPEDTDQWRYGMDARYLAELIDYWRDEYDWRAQEAELNEWPQFKAEIDGIDIHFIHIPGDARQKPPIILTHGWPGSIFEFHDVIPKFQAAGFPIVIPSLPGFGWSGRPRQPIGPRKIADLWRKLMVDVLGYPSFFAQGGDWGSAVTSQLAIDHSDVVRAIHVNFFTAPFPGPDADQEILDYWAEVGRLMEKEGGYSHEHATRPQTIGLALHDNPVGWAAWVVEKFWCWADTKGEIESSFTKDQLITILMTYLVTDSVISSMWIYNGYGLEAQAPGPIPVPTAIAKFPGELYPAPRRELAARQYNLVRWTEMERGGHFAAMEAPDAFAEDVVAFFNDLS